MWTKTKQTVAKAASVLLTNFLAFYRGCVWFGHERAPDSVNCRHCRKYVPVDYL